MISFLGFNKVNKQQNLFLLITIVLGCITFLKNSFVNPVLLVWSVLGLTTGILKIRKEAFTLSRELYVLLALNLLFYLSLSLNFFHPDTKNENTFRYFETRGSSLLIALIFFINKDIVNYNMDRLITLIARSLGVFCMFIFLYVFLQNLQLNTLGNCYNSEHSLAININEILKNCITPFLPHDLMGHRSYISLVFNFSISVLLYRFVIKRINKEVFYLIPVVTMVFALSSRTAIFVLFLSCLAIMVYFLKKNFSKKNIIIFASVISILTISLLINPRVNAYLHITKEKPKIEAGNQRVKLFGAGLQLVKENLLFGVGADNVQSSLLELLKDDEYFVRKKLDAHNQFLQIFIGQGVFVFLLFSLFMSAFLWRFIKQRNIIGAILFMNIAINFLTESMLNFYKGVMIFSFYLFLLALKERDENPKVAY